MGHDEERKFRILLVDDDLACLQSLEDMLSADGFRVASATCGRDALALVRRAPRGIFRISMLDYHTPDWTGPETYSRLCEELPGLDAIFMSGDISAEVSARVQEVGGRSLLPKPLDITRVRREIQGLLSR